MTVAGLAMEVHEHFCTQAKEVLRRLALMKKEVERTQSFLPLFYQVRGRVIGQAYRRDASEVEVGGLLKLAGANESRLDYEVFCSAPAKKCPPQEFEARTRLKIQRTLLNLKELHKAYGQADLQELEAQLQTDLQESNPLRLRQKLVALARSANFSTYLSLKQDFLDQWMGSNASQEGKFESIPLVNKALSETMKALLRQKSDIKKKPQVLRFTDHQFFQQFNATTHDAFQSRDLEFWQTEENRQAFLKMIQTIRQRYPVEAPFHIFRFADSFTYLLCGFSDDSTSDAILRECTTVPVHAKILMRQSNKSYRELLSHDTENRTLYFKCLKEAMRPFVEELNKGLKMDLPESFIQFFRV